MKELLHRRKV